MAIKCWQEKTAIAVRIAGIFSLLPPFAIPSSERASN
jgi:hypothetical protein